MAILYTCMECGAELNGRGLRPGLPVVCGQCGHEFTVPLRVDMAAAAADDGPEVFAPTAVAAHARRPGRPVDRGEFGGLGQGPVYAAAAAVFLGLGGIVSPWPVRVGVVAVLVAAVAYLAWQLSAAFGLTGGKRPEPAAVVVRSALIAAVAGLLAIWGVMVQGRDVFAPQSASPPDASAAEAAPPATAVRPRRTLRFFAAVPPPAATGPATTEPADVMPPVPATVPATAPAAVVTDIAAERAAADAAAAKRADDRDAREKLSAVHLRALVAAADDYAKAHGRYPFSTGDLPGSRELRAAVRSPFDPAGGAAVGYVVIAGGKLPAAATAELPVVYDAAELADQGTTVGITAAGRLLYLDSDEVTVTRAAWAAR